MRLFDFFKTRTQLDNLTRTFSFLTTDYGFTLVETGTGEQKNYKGRNLAVYRNDKSKLQLELIIIKDFFHCEIRRLLNGQPANYSDKDNCIPLYQLAVLESNNDEKHIMQFSTEGRGLKGVLRNSVSLFKRHKDFFTTDRWIDTKKIQQLLDEELERKFGPFPVKTTPKYYEEIKRQATQFLSDQGYKLILDSAELPPYDEDKQVENIRFQKGDKKIKISQLDWRDDYYIYYIEVNGDRLFEIDLSKQNDTLIAIEQTLQKLRQLT
jgi:hypothetical protein